MLKKAIAAAFVSAGLLVTVAPGASAAPPAAACHGITTAHGAVPHFDNHGTHHAHTEALPAHCH